MKHGFLKHTVTAALALILLGSLIPAAVSAYGIDYGRDFYGKLDPSGPNRPVQQHLGTIPVGKSPITIKAEDYGGYYAVLDGQYYQLIGMNAWNVNNYYSQVINNGKTSLTLPGFPGGDEIDFQRWQLDNAYYISLNYYPHTHVIPRNAPWYADNNNHWKCCPYCKDIAYINYHHDVDNDGICDECRQPIHYRYITVKDAPGGKVEISKDKCMIGNRVAVTVTPDAGYKLQEIHGVSADNYFSPRPCYEDVKGSQYHMIVDVYDVEIQPTFVKE